jgi:hypothetical protein
MREKSEMGYDSIELYFDFPKEDKFVDQNLYKKGTAFIYYSDACKQFVEKCAKKLGYKVRWNNIGTIGWII